jgi:cytochrome c oxidase subunit 2
MWFTIRRNYERFESLTIHQGAGVGAANKKGPGMKFSKWFIGLGAFVAALFTVSAVWAGTGQPSPWQMGLQGAVTPVAEDIHWFHNMLLVIITLITLFVLGLLIMVMVKFNAKANPVPSKTTHNTMIEVLWTVIPILILVIIAIPSFRLLYLQRNIPAPDMTIKVIGNPSWNWTYEYPDLGLNEDKTAKVTFTAFLKPEAEAKAAGEPFLLATDVPVVVPVNKVVKLIVTSDPDGIIHAWTIPSFGMKIDAIPGRLNEDWFQATAEGTYYGQCSELCGKDHAFMPIEVRVVSEADFNAWAEKAKTAGIEEARKYLVALLKAKGQLARN